ncbi:hypothetical protein STRAU_4416 [Streptomyces aurantiacus JA 4570]|uniref:Uncharacterized protein n=1 Tax=Streptomyces aurantiacus JA 4570 TaxID=1286094 RepID=S4AM74_9ACTN|nr:hypothetical protein STRAU_4416 [Streptomyces aurantiacus JA 4570]
MAATGPGAKVSSPQGDLGCTWTSSAPAPTASAADAARAPGDSGTAAPSSAPRAPFRHTCIDPSHHGGGTG